MAAALALASCSKTTNTPKNEVFPFSENEVYIQEADRHEWSLFDVDKDEYGIGIKGFFFKNNLDPLKVLTILYNPKNGKTLKMIIAGEAIDGKVRYTYSTINNVAHLKLTLDGNEGYDPEFGVPLDLSQLGIVRGAQSALTSLPTKLICGGDTFGACMTCAVSDCTGNWVCATTCALIPLECVTSTVIYCSLAYDPTKGIYIVPLPVADTLLKLTKDSIHFKLLP